MVLHYLREDEGILVIEPASPLSTGDVEAITKKVDAHLEAEGRLHGLLIHTQKVPGWNSVGAMVKHIQFIDEHHARIDKVALVTDGILGKVAEQVGSHFLNAEIRQFDYDSYDEAERWLLD